MSSDKDKEVPMIGLPDPDSDPAYARLRTALGDSGAGLAPRPGWEEQVWARIDGSGAAKVATAGARWGWFASGAMLAAAAIALLVWQPWGGTATQPTGAQVAMASPSISIRKGSQIMRGTTAAPGDTLVVHHDVSSAAVWVYFEDALVSESGGRVELVLERPGTYHVISTVGPWPGRAPTELDAALAALLTAGTAHHRHTVEVR